MPCDYSKYPADWKERRRRILQRDGHKCALCGVPNHVIVHRKDDKWRIVDFLEAKDLHLAGEKTTYIVLTIMHLKNGPKDCPDEDMAAGCQRCHLRYDLKKHVSNAAMSRRLKKESLGQVPMFEGEECQRAL